MSEENIKLVEFEKYCKTCTHKNNKDTDDPCNECLTEAARFNSHKPLHYVKA